MIDFTGVTALTIPEGNVIKITRGMETLWEKPTSDLGYTIVFPATTFTNADLTYEYGWTYLPEQVLTRTPSDGEHYAIFVNGVEYDFVAEVRGSSIELCVNDDMFMAIADFDGTNRSFYTILYDTYESVTLEIHYIPKWEIVFPATTYAESDFIDGGDGFYLPNGYLSCIPQDGETYVIYINGEEHIYTAEQRGTDTVELCVDETVYCATRGINTAEFYVYIEATFDSVTLEIHRARY